MKTRKDGAALRQLSALFNLGAVRELSDGQLLERFSTARGEVAELAFAALVERHGAMVMRVCRAHLREPHDAQDAFQATFFILVKKARALWVHDSLGPWLHQVACRTASCARTATDRRRKHERRKAELTETFDQRVDSTGSEWVRVLHEEIDRLPERYRVPIVLCDLQGHTCDEAARWMGRPVGTVKSWRSRGREHLRGRLLRRGLAPSAGLGMALAADAAQAMVPKCTAEEAIHSAVRTLANRTTAREISTAVNTLVKGVLETMFLGKLRTAAITLFALALVAAGVGALAQVGTPDANQAGLPSRPEVAQPEPPPIKDARETWNLTLRDAIRIGLDNPPIVRVVTLGGHKTPDDTCVIAPLTPDADALQFKTEVMAQLRTIEQQYWSLAQQYAQLAAGERAAEVALDVLKREQAELSTGRGNRDDVAEAEVRLEQFRLDVVTKTSDVITTDRQLRNVLGLPPTDGRRIVPITPPTEALLEPNWDASLATMLDKQPDIQRVKAEAKHNDPGDVEKKKATVHQVTRQTTHSLARFFLELGANYKQFKTASRLRAAAAQRLESQRAFYEEGRIPIDRYFDVVSQYASAVAQEAQFKTVYNISIVAFEEAKGTLLEYDKIAVAGEPTPDVRDAERTFRTGEFYRRTGKNASAEYDFSKIPQHWPNSPWTDKAKAHLEGLAEEKRHASPPDRVDTAVTRAKNDEKDEGPAANHDGKTLSFQFTVGRRSNPVEIRGSLTITPVRPAETSKAP